MQSGRYFEVLLIAQIVYGSRIDVPSRQATIVAGSGTRVREAGPDTTCGILPGKDTMSDEPNRRNLLARLLAMKDLPLTPAAAPAVRTHALAMSAAQIDAVRTALAGEVRDWLGDPSLATRPLASMTQEESDAVCDAAYSALMNAAPIVRSYTARRDKGTYPSGSQASKGCTC